MTACFFLLFNIELLTSTEELVGTASTTTIGTTIVTMDTAPTAPGGITQQQPVARIPLPGLAMEYHTVVSRHHQYHQLSSNSPLITAAVVPDGNRHDDDDDDDDTGDSGHGTGATGSTGSGFSDVKPYLREPLTPRKSRPPKLPPKPPPKYMVLSTDTTVIPGEYTSIR